MDSGNRTNPHRKYSPRQVWVTIVTKGEFQDLLKRTLCDEFGQICTSQIATAIGRTAYTLHGAVSLVFIVHFWFYVT